MKPHRCASVDIEAVERAFLHSKIVRDNVTDGLNVQKGSSLMLVKQCAGSCSIFVRDMKRLVLQPGQAEEMLKDISGSKLAQALRRHGLQHQFCTR